ncbi:hypothetical protein NEMIN01_0788 [Nematocida minor]|uniref:uncharacterized protein n=1 Tax=Nematocida minor TaxID=1912983 RepID=UPI00221F28AF|nr:uncharacterized protein NEMIN01_0788 [Nematocida minor]KAI5190003.1 hypothetical protein NEMIN01_0788 [Nematocida minor]
MIRARPKLYTVEEVAQNNHRKSCWVILSGLVYDVTDYVKEHPGGADIILENGGKDCTVIFNTIHPWINYKKLLENRLIGYVKKEPQKSDAQNS